jgi:sulfane dehydrogenase subunit SoxC
LEGKGLDDDLRRALEQAEPVAGGGLLDRRAFLRMGSASVGAFGAVVGGLGASGLAGAVEVARADAGADRPTWMRAPGAPMRGYGSPSPREQHVMRHIQRRYGATAPGAGASLTPLHALEGTLTPSGLHFERHHSGVPEIDPEQHALRIHGLVERPLSFTLDALLRYPMTSRICFLECSGNSVFGVSPEPLPLSCGELHGLVSCSEWSGVPLALLLDEAGIDPRAGWVVFEGGDAAGMVRSLPLSLAAREGIVALYQNGERIRPEQGHPMRLLMPGLEGNVSVKWLRRIELTTGPAYARDETSKYTDLQDDGTARQFSFEMGVKSVVTKPSGGLTMQGPGFYEISGLAWSGAGRIGRVDVSADGGRTWAEAALQEPVLSKSLTRFRIPWRWAGGGVARIQSRATDETGRVQPTRDEWIAGSSLKSRYHYNAIQTWSVEPDGSIRNVYA